MDLLTKGKLSLFMFLEYFIWGSWYVTMGNYLFTNFNVSAIEVGSAYGNLSIGALISPFFIGLIADRYFAPKYVIAVLHALGAIILWIISDLSDFSNFWWLILLYCMLFMPTISLSNSISFSLLKNPTKEFPFIRVFGTIGWIVTGLILGYNGLEASPFTFKLAAAASIMLVLLALILPQSKPSVQKEASIKSVIGLDSLSLLKDRSYLTFFICSIGICIPLSFYYSFTNAYLNDIGLDNVSGKMTFGQISEFVFMLFIPFMFRRLGVKAMLLIAVVAWILRYTLFAFADIESGTWMLMTGILLHGICYDFFFVTGQIYTDSKADDKTRNSAQGLLTFATYGVGMVIGAYISGFITEIYVLEESALHLYNWKNVWLIPAYFSVFILIIILIFFKEKLFKRRRISAEL